MKKILLIIAATFATAVAVSAQDMAQATETYNNGATAQMAGNNAEAVEYYKSALTMAEACGEEGSEIVGKCKEYIPNLLYSMGKEAINNKQYDDAFSKLNEAISCAKEWGIEGIVDEAEQIKNVGYMNKANDLFNAKDYEGAIAAYNEILKTNPSNGIAQLRLGMAYAQAENLAKAEETYLAAAANGQEKAAKKQLAKMFLKEAQKALKNKENAAAYEFATKSNGYITSGNALYLAGRAAQNLGQSAKANEAFEQFLVVSPNDSKADDIRYTLAVSYQNEKNTSKAIEYYKQILSSPKWGETAKAQIAALGK